MSDKFCSASNNKDMSVINSRTPQKQFHIPAKHMFSIPKINRHQTSNQKYFDIFLKIKTYCQKKTLNKNKL